MKKPKRPEFVYLILKGINTPITDLKTILAEKKVVSQDGEFRFYSPYNALYDAYYHKFQGRGMWGVGFRTRAIIDKAFFLKDGQPVSHSLSSTDKSLHSYLIEADTFLFDKLIASYNDEFLIVPDQKAQDEICYYGRKPNTGYKQWWVKGLRNDICGNKTEEEIYDYLND